MILNGSSTGMRIRPQPTREQRKELQAALRRFQQPEVALDVVRSCLDAGFEPETVVCNVQSVHPDRFVVQVRVQSSGGEELGYALKVYSDDFGSQLWGLGQALQVLRASNHDGLCLPRQYVRHERALVFPWVEGTRLSDIVDHRKPALLRHAAVLVADLHRTRLTTMPALTAEMVVAETLDRCDRLRYRWPSMDLAVQPLMRLLQKTAVGLDPARPAVIHGDLAAGQFVWTGDRLVLLDMDTTRRADPAYDVGHFLGQLERRCVLDTSLPEHAKDWLSCFRDTYPARALGVSWRNVAFYQGVTLMRKMYTLSRRDPIGGPRLAIRLVDRARAAFEAAAGGR